MLLLTERVRAAIQTLTKDPKIPLGTGLRISVAPDDDAILQITLESDPRPGDDVINRGGIWVFLDQRASRLLVDQILDVRHPETGSDFFFTAQ